MLREKKRNIKLSPNEPRWTPKFPNKTAVIKDSRNSRSTVVLAKHWIAEFPVEEQGDWHESDACYPNTAEITSVKNTASECKAHCLSEDNCSCVTYQSSSKTCWLRSTCALDDCDDSKTDVTSAAFTLDPQFCDGTIPLGFNLAVDDASGKKQTWTNKFGSGLAEHGQVSIIW